MATTATSLRALWWGDVIGEESDRPVLSKEPAHVHHTSTDSDGSVGNDGPVEVGRASDGGRAADAEEGVASPRSVLEEDPRSHCGRKTGADLKDELAVTVPLAVKREHAVQRCRRGELVDAGGESQAAEGYA